MRTRPVPPPSARAIGQTWIQVLVRDYPELLEVIESRGIDAGAAACRSPVEMEPGNPGLVEALEAALRWRALAGSRTEHAPLRRAGRAPKRTED